MPTVNVFYTNNSQVHHLETISGQLREYLAVKLTCGDRKLTPGEISIRFIQVTGGQMIGEIELEITAHAYSERIEKQDVICREVADFIKKQIPEIGELQIWLKLCELGHSWQ